MGIWIGAIVLLWVSWLWPVIISTFYLIWKEKITHKKVKFFILNVVIGYLVMGLSFIAPALIFMSGLIKPTPGMGLFLIFLLPLLSTHFVAKKFKLPEPEAGLANNQ